jgi:hypothetical protein
MGDNNKLVVITLFTTTITKEKKMQWQQACSCRPFSLQVERKKNG